ncbi:MAG TPA: hypothetical protein VEI97_03570, partial [bacterium]|nr:hypothetical protein [bacterium]
MSSERRFPPFQFRIGRVIRPAVEETTRNGKTLVKFPISVNQSYEKGDDYWLDVAVFSERGRKAALALSKG